MRLQPSLQALARALFMLLLLWPALHMALTLNFGVSAWRLFGWGMYATPYPMTHSQCVVVWAETELGEQSVLDDALAAAIEQPKPALNPGCVLALHLDTPWPPEAICDDPELSEHLAFLTQFGAATHALALVRRSAALQKKPPSARAAYVVVRRPRVRLWPLRHYVEATVFAVSGNQVHTYPSRQRHASPNR